MQKFSIVAPIGGFGNHLRWLLLLDPKFNFKFTDFNISPDQFYAKQFIAGQQFPKYRSINYEEFCQQNEEELDKNLLEEYIESFNLRHLDFSSSQQKIKSIEKYVYYKSRTWHNWIETERKFRFYLDPVIEFRHWERHFTSDEKILVLSPKYPTSTLRSYLKFNCNLNGLSKEEFIWHNGQYKICVEKLASNNSSVCLLHLETLLNPVLNKDFYQTAITHFGLSDCYENANYVHGLWYNLQKQSESDLLFDLQKFYNS